jgi:hypothetical protein
LTACKLEVAEPAGVETGTAWLPHAESNSENIMIKTGRKAGLVAIDPNSAFERASGQAGYDLPFSKYVENDRW